MTPVDAIERLVAVTVPQGEWTLTIDFGATFTEVTASWPENYEVILIDGERQMPSAVAVDDASELCVGRAAEEIARSRPDRTERELKRRLGEKTAIVLGDRSFDPVVLVGAVLRHAADAAIDQFGSSPVKVRLTHPDTWSDARIAKLAEAGTNVGLINVVTATESGVPGPTIAETAAELPNDSESLTEPCVARTLFEEVAQTGTSAMPTQPPNPYAPIPPTTAATDAPKRALRTAVLAGAAIGAVLMAGLGFAFARGDSPKVGTTTTTSGTTATTTTATTTTTTAPNGTGPTPTVKIPGTLPPRKTPTTLFPSKDPDDTLPLRPAPPTALLPPRSTPSTSARTRSTTVAPTPSTTFAPPRTTVPTTTPAPPPATTVASTTTVPPASNRRG